jgi:transcriptional regulator GlxA family with amidase domain
MTGSSQAHERDPDRSSAVRVSYGQTWLSRAGSFRGILELGAKRDSGHDVPVRRTRHILLLAVEGCQSLDVLGPVEVFHHASQEARGAYRLEVVGPADGGAVTMENGLRLGVAPLPEPPPRHDTLLVAGGSGARAAVEDAAIVDWVARASRRARRTVSVCTGAYLLAAAGLLDDRQATTHWRHCDDLAERYAKVRIDPDPVFVHDGNVWTSAGVTAGMDLALALVEEDLGPEVALTVARQLVVFLKRPGGQSQFSSALSAQQAARPALRELQAWIAGHLDEDLTVPVLAERAYMSERTFARAFTREVGQTPAAYVEALRIEHARALLEDGAPSLEAVAQAAGFASAEVLRRAFHRRVGVSPAEYRERFRLVG